jgi:stage II sporulation protein D
VLSLVLALAAAGGAVDARAAATITITGHGNGHGIGLSQWGAEGLARGGATYQQILQHYYPGTTLEVQPPSKIRVLIMERARLAIGVGAIGAATADDGDPLPVSGALRVVPRAVGGVELHDAGGALIAGGLWIRIHGPTTITIGGNPYRGDVLVRRNGSLVQGIDDLSLEDYVRGVISWEVPSSWLPDTLAAQAVAARSYALAERRTGRPFDVYSDTRSQMYGGIRAERATTDAAVAGTAGLAVMYAGAVATTFFSDSNGGRVAAIQDVWGGAAIPYLVSTPDPMDAIAPFNTWAPRAISPSDLGKALGIARPVAISIRSNPSRRVDAITFTTAGGGSVTLSGATIQLRLRLRSSWFALRLLDLRSVRRRRHRVAIVGTISPAGTVRVEGLVDGQWLLLGKVAARNGTVSWRGPDHGATAFRLRAGDALSAPHH